jgi:cell division protein FtsA
MSTRIGYPNEHLAKSKVEAVTSPLFATGVGLVLRGFDFLERRRSTQVLELPKVKAHSQKFKVGSFFDKVVQGATEIFKDDEA